MGQGLSWQARDRGGGQSGPKSLGPVPSHQPGHYPSTFLEVSFISSVGTLGPLGRAHCTALGTHGGIHTPGSAMTPSRHTLANKTAHFILATILTAVLTVHAQMGTLALRELRDLPRIIQAQAESTAPDLLELNPGFFPLLSLAALPIHPLEHRMGPALFFHLLIS